jgi:succinate-acetate transporter protein
MTHCGIGAATIGAFCGMLQIVGSMMEWTIGNTFPFVVFSSCGALWLAVAVTLQPAYIASAAYTEGLTGTAEAAAEAEFLSSFGEHLPYLLLLITIVSANFLPQAFFILCMGILTLMYLICALRINLVFVIIFLFLDIAFFLLAAAYWLIAQGNTDLASKVEIVRRNPTYNSLFAAKHLHSSKTLS